MTITIAYGSRAYIIDIDAGTMLNALLNPAIPPAQAMREAAVTQRQIAREALKRADRLTQAAAILEAQS